MLLGRLAALAVEQRLQYFKEYDPRECAIGKPEYTCTAAVARWTAHLVWWLHCFCFGRYRPENGGGSVRGLCCMGLMAVMDLIARMEYETVLLLGFDGNSTRSVYRQPLAPNHSITHQQLLFVDSQSVCSLLRAQWLRLGWSIVANSWSALVFDLFSISLQYQPSSLTCWVINSQRSVLNSGFSELSMFKFPTQLNSEFSILNSQFSILKCENCFRSPYHYFFEDPAAYAARDAASSWQAVLEAMARPSTNRPKDLAVMHTRPDSILSSFISNSRSHTNKYSFLGRDNENKNSYEQVLVAFAAFNGLRLINLSPWENTLSKVIFTQTVKQMVASFSASYGCDWGISRDGRDWSLIELNPKRYDRLVKGCIKLCNHEITYHAHTV